MKKQKPMSSSRAIVLFSTFTVILSCQPNPDFYGTYSYCNEEGYYVEVSFLSSDKLIIAHELIPDGREYQYEVKKDTMLTYDLEGRLLSKCGIANFQENQVVISLAEEDSIYEFVYSRIAKEPFMIEVFKDTTDAGYEEYLTQYLERRMKKGCPTPRQPARINIEEMDTVFNDF